MPIGAIVDFLIDLSHDPDELERFKKDPAIVVAAAGFTGQEAEVLASGDFRKLMAHLKPVNFGDDVPDFIFHRPRKKKKRPAKGGGPAKKPAKKKTRSPKKK